MDSFVLLLLLDAPLELDLTESLTKFVRGWRELYFVSSKLDFLVEFFPTFPSMDFCPLPTESKTGCK